MNILVIDVAAEHSGALTVLNQFIDEFEEDLDNQYTVVLGKIRRENTSNIRYINIEWVKNSWFHRLYFDQVYIRKLVRRIKPEKILSLQNGCVKGGHIPQDVFFHNALPICEKRFSFSESKTLWIYQQIIGRMWRRSLRKANHILVQAEWIKQALIRKWHIEEKHILVKRPIIDECFQCDTPQRKEKLQFFYPANGEIYKNHEKMLYAFKSIWDTNKEVMPSLVLSGKFEDLPENCRIIISSGSYPVSFAGRLSREEMREMYSQSTLVFPSYLETVGLPLLEARAMGSDILAADCEYARDAVGSYEKAIFFPPHEIDSIRGKIEEYIQKWKETNEDSDS